MFLKSYYMLLQVHHDKKNWLISDFTPFSISALTLVNLKDGTTKPDNLAECR